MGGLPTEDSLPASSALSDLNALDPTAAAELLLTVCSSHAWALALSDSRPYDDVAALADRADAVMSRLSEADVDEALAGHPRIGERSSHASSQREQAAVATAAADLLEQIRAGNTAYEQRFGHVYLVRAAGRTPTELLAILHDRLGHDAETERTIVREQLAEINRLRLQRLVSGDAT